MSDTNPLGKEIVIKVDNGGTSLLNPLGMSGIVLFRTILVFGAGAVFIFYIWWTSYSIVGKGLEFLGEVYDATVKKIGEGIETVGNAYKETTVGKEHYEAVNNSIAKVQIQNKASEYEKSNISTNKSLTEAEKASKIRNINIVEKSRIMVATNPLTAALKTGLALVGIKSDPIYEKSYTKEEITKVDSKGTTVGYSYKLGTIASNKPTPTTIKKVVQDVPPTLTYIIDPKYPSNIRVATLHRNEKGVFVPMIPPGWQITLKTPWD